VTAIHPATFEQPAFPAPERRALAWMGGLVLGFIALIVLVLLLFNWNWLRGPIARLASDTTGRRVRIDGDLKVHLLTWQPRVSVGGLKIGQPAWAGQGDMARIDALVVETRWMSLLHGKPVLPLVELDHPVLDLERDAKGRANWSLSNGPSSADTKLPPIQRFVVDGGHVHYADVGRKIVVDGTVDSNERTGGPSAHAFNLVGHGSINKNPFEISLTGGPLINVKLDQPYPFAGTVRAGDTHVEANGQLAKPFDFGVYSTNLRVSGDDLADLYDLTGLALPNTPVYDLHGHLQHTDKLYRFTGLGGRVGSSDLSGEFSVSTAHPRPFVDARLRSRSLDFKDLATLFGAPPMGKAAATATPMQKAQAAAMAANQRMLPDAPLYIERVRKMDAKLAFTVDAVRDSPFPFRNADLKLRLDRGLLTIDPLTANFPQGSMWLQVALNGRGSTPVTDLDLRLSNLAIQNFVPASAGAPPIEGTLAARAKLHGVGDSVHKAAAASSGAVTIVIPHGHMRKAFAELLGVNVGNGLSLLLSKNKDESDIRCGVAAFDVRGGQLQTRQLIFDTDVVRVNGEGGASFGDERLNLVLKGDTKKFRLLHVFLPITVQGHFRSPKLGVQPGQAVAQGGVAVALGALLTPLAALLPFVDPGLAKNADCQALMAEAKQTAAPVKGPLPTATNKK
jgi:uncharacterized protein involved in outer membrane biogenesis